MNISNCFVGEVKAFSGITIPTHWLLCDGSAISRVDYAILFEVIGTTYGTGDGSTTFNIPDLRNRVLVGAGDSYSLHQTFGNNSISYTPESSNGNTGDFTLETKHLPSHSHTYNKPNANTGSYTLKVADIPSHKHTFTKGRYLSVASGSAIAVNDYYANSGAISENTGNTGDGGGHSHTIGTDSTNSGTTGSGTAHAHSFTGKAASLDVRQPSIALNFIICCF